MSTATLEQRAIKATVTQTPTDGKGTFDFVVHPFEVDSANERIKNFANLPATVPMDYSHANDLLGDPGATIGEARVAVNDGTLAGSAKLNLEGSPMAVAVYERLLLPEGDPQRLSEVSIFFSFDTAKAFKGDSGELVQVDAMLLGVAVVHKGAQRTTITNVKSEKAVNWANEAEVRAHYAGLSSIDGSAIDITVTTQYPEAAKVGRVLSGKNESRIQQIHDLSLELLSDLKREADTEGKTEEPTAAKVEDRPVLNALLDEYPDLKET